ncbi:MAG: hypothetical protein FWC55_06270 [Firmicutes bacterium]|nr:hypothetical protein [Bacillota bacterium]
MADILMINLPLAGHTNPTLPLTEALVRRGHKVSYINAEEYRSKIESTGAEFIPYENFPAAPTERQKRTGIFRAAFDTGVNLERKYDLLIYEMFFYPGIRIAEKRGIPCVRQFSQQALNVKMLPHTTLRRKLASVLIDFSVMGTKNAKYMGLKNGSLGAAILYDKPPLNVVYVPQIFQSERDTFGEEYMFTVPMSESVSVTREIPYEAMKPPIVYISLGSLLSNKRFYAECVRAFGGKDVSVILNTGKVCPEELGKIPGNIYAYSYVPQVEVLRHADVFLTHCGMNSVNEAMRFGVPMVAMPLMNDQISNAERIVSLGIGKRARSFPRNGRQLYETVKEVYEDEQIRRRCAAIQGLFEKESSLDDVVDRIEKLLGQPCEKQFVNAP